MDLFTAIAERHSYRGSFKSEPVPREDLRRIVEAALLAPSGKNAQTTQFVIVDDPDDLKRIGQLHPVNKAMREAGAMIACIIDAAPDAVYEGYSFQAEDCAAAVENMLLAVTALGYATVWIDGWLRLDGRAERIGEVLGLPAGKTLRVLLPVGIPLEGRPVVARKPFEARAWFGRYGGEGRV